MAALSGTAGSVAWTTSGTASFGEITEWSLAINMDPVETTSFGDSWADFVASIRTATGSFTGNFDRNDTAQGSAIAYALAGSAVNLRLYAGTSYFGGSAYITGLEPAITIAGKADVAYNFQSVGAWTLT